MGAQKRETGRNYIGLLHEETNERRMAGLSAAAKYHMLDLAARCRGAAT